MKPKAVILAVGLLVAGAGLAGAAERTVTLSVGNMSCASCKYIVKSSLSRVAGVVRVVVSYEAQTATVTYDDRRTNERALTQATGQYGFPSKIVAQGSGS
jgi:mercuric ion binding protein